jgi:hypothetical protein
VDVNGLDIVGYPFSSNPFTSLLYTWGEAMGLTAPPTDAQPCPLESFEFKALVFDTLQMLLRLFSDTSKMEVRYGCRGTTAEHPSGPVLPSHGRPSPIDNLAMCFTDFSIAIAKNDISVRKKTQWVVQDRKKFFALVSEVKDLIDGLQDITKSISTANRQERIVNHRIQKIDQIETLQLVSEVCEIDHPNISDAASVKLDVLSMATTQRDEIEKWENEISPSDIMSSDIESLTITELKHRLQQIMERGSSSEQRGLEQFSDKSSDAAEFDDGVSYGDNVKVCH